MSGPGRFVRFVRFAWRMRSSIVQIHTHNLRACWVQSDPEWLSKVEPWDLTDEEVAAFLAALEEIG